MKTFPYQLAEERAPQIGLIALQSDETVERDMLRLLGQTAEVLVTRVPSATHVSAESLAAMEARLQGAAALLPAGARLSVVGYGCTSGTAQIGARRVAEAVRAGIPTRAVTEPVSALIAACRRMGVARMGLLSPYVAEVSDRLRAVLAEAGISVTDFGSFNEAEEAKVVRIAPGSVIAAARALADAGRMDALFISCTNLRTLDIIAPVEASTGLPVLSSNQVLAWHMAQLAGLTAAPDAPGRLFVSA